MIKQAIILAAGLGTRMGKLTQAVPKPMIEVFGQSMITRTIDLLIRYGIDKIYINSFYKANLLEDHIRDHAISADILDKVFITKEIELLNTGGGVLNLLQHMDNTAPFFVINGDSIWCGEENVFSYLSSQWDKLSEDDLNALFLLRKKEEGIGFSGKGDFDLDANNQLIKSDSTHLPYAYASIHIANPKLFMDIPLSKCGLMDIYARCKKQDTFQEIKGVLYHGLWCHVGTQKALQETEAALKEL